MVPQWDPEKKVYTLPFYNRASLTSVHNFMLARPEAQRLFAEVARRLRHRLLQPPNRTVTDAPLPPLCPPLLSSPLPLAFPTSSAFPGSAALSPAAALSLSSLSLHLSTAPLACRLAHH